MAGAIFVNQATAGLVELLPYLDREVVVNAIAGTSRSLFNTLSEQDQKAALKIIVHAIDNVSTLRIGDWTATMANESTDTCY